MDQKTPLAQETSLSREFCSDQEAPLDQEPCPDEETRPDQGPDRIGKPDRIKNLPSSGDPSGSANSSGSEAPPDLDPCPDQIRGRARTPRAGSAIRRASTPEALPCEMCAWVAQHLRGRSDAGTCGCLERCAADVRHEKPGSEVIPRPRGVGHLGNSRHRHLELTTR